MFLEKNVFSFASCRIIVYSRDNSQYFNGGFINGTGSIAV